MLEGLTITKDGGVGTALCCSRKELLLLLCILFVGEFLFLAFDGD